MSDVAFKVVEGRTVKGAAVLYVYGQKYMGSVFCTPEEVEAFTSALEIGCEEMRVPLTSSSFDHNERTS